MNKIAVLIGLAAVMFGSLLVLAPQPSYALFENSKNQACAGVELQDKSSACENNNSATSINNLLITGLNLLSLVIGIIAVVMVIIGGMRFILSGGDSNNVSSARNTIIYAIVGLVIVALAQVIVHFVLSRVKT